MRPVGIGPLVLSFGNGHWEEERVTGDGLELGWSWEGRVDGLGEVLPLALGLASILSLAA